MRRTNHIRRGWMLAVVASVMIGAASVQGASVTLFLEITNELLDGQGNALADGSVIYVIGTPSDGVMDPVEFSPGVFLPATTTGDNVIIATLSLNSLSTGVPGTMVAAFTVDLGEFDLTQAGAEIYLRFFDFQGSPPPVGQDLEWGTTAPVAAYEIFAGALYGVDIPGAQVSRTNTFIAIPEPATFDLYLVAGVLIALLGVWRPGRKAVRVTVST